MRDKILLIDAGNSRIKCGLTLISQGAGFKEKIELLKPFQATQLSENLNALRFDPPDSVWLSNVAGEKIEALLLDFVRSNWNLEIRCVKSCLNGFGVTNGYQKPERLGVDRWVCLIAARHFGSLPVCIADCGTAITFDVLDASGIHLGGLISPGLNLMQNALIQGTDALNASQGDYFNVLADNTEAAIFAGSLQSAAGLIERAWTEMGKRFGCDPLLLLTGGDAALISKTLKIPHDIVVDLVLRGLSIIARNQA